MLRSCLVSYPTFIRTEMLVYPWSSCGGDIIGTPLGGELLADGFFRASTGWRGFVFLPRVRIGSRIRGWLTDHCYVARRPEAGLLLQYYSLARASPSRSCFFFLFCAVVGWREFLLVSLPRMSAGDLRVRLKRPFVFRSRTRRRGWFSPVRPLEEAFFSLARRL